MSFGPNSYNNVTDELAEAGFVPAVPGTLRPAEWVFAPASPVVHPYTGTAVVEMSGGEVVLVRLQAPWGEGVADYHYTTIRDLVNGLRSPA